MSVYRALRELVFIIMLICSLRFTYNVNTISELNMWKHYYFLAVAICF